MGDTLIKADGNRITKTVETEMVVVDDGVPRKVVKPQLMEKAYEVHYWDGLKTRKTYIRGLNEVIGGRRLEDIVQDALLRPSGHIRIMERDSDGTKRKLFIKATNIVSCEEVWVKA